MGRIGGHDERLGTGRGRLESGRASNGRLADSAFAGEQDYAHRWTLPAPVPNRRWSPCFDPLLQVLESTFDDLAFGLSLQDAGHGEPGIDRGLVGHLRNVFELIERIRTAQLLDIPLDQLPRECIRRVGIVVAERIGNGSYLRVHLHPHSGGTALTVALGDLDFFDVRVPRGVRLEVRYDF